LRWLAAVNGALGPIVVLAVLLACKRHDERAPAAVVSAQQTVTARPLFSGARRESVPVLATQLDGIMRAPADFASGKDDTGDKTVTYNLKPLDGVGLAYFVGVRGQPKAWRFGLESMRCHRIGELGLELVELQRGDGRPLSASWYRVEGGPLSKLLVKVFPGAAADLCNVMPGTPTYWELEGERPG
jgi:hypothetical protein